MFLLVENYQTDHSSWSSDRLGIFEKHKLPCSPWLRPSRTDWCSQLCFGLVEYRHGLLFITCHPCWWRVEKRVLCFPVFLLRACLDALFILFDVVLWSCVFCIPVSVSL